MPLNQELRDWALDFTELESQATDQQLLTALVAMIEHPDRIDDTNDFASLLAETGDECFVDPLIDKIACGVPDKTLWLADYMYALIVLLNECEDCHQVDESFAHLLGDWLLNRQGGEISWKAGDILAEVVCSASKEYLVKGAGDESLFHLTRISCLRGVVNHFRADARPLLESLAGDSDLAVREACLDAMAHLERCEERAQQEGNGQPTNCPVDEPGV